MFRNCSQAVYNPICASTVSANVVSRTATPTERKLKTDFDLNPGRGPCLSDPLLGLSCAHAYVLLFMNCWHEPGGRCGWLQVQLRLEPGYAVVSTEDIAEVGIA